MNSNINIFNSKNYKKEIDKEDLSILLKEYWLIMKEYIKFLIENIKIKENKEHFYFIFKRGLDTFKHILNLLLIYTKNITLIIYHLKKSYLYYVEFVGQIGHDNHAYLQLNSRDAALFVYKKTIHEINNEQKKNTLLSDEENKKFLEYYRIINAYNNLVESIIRKEKEIKYQTIILNYKFLDKIINKIKDNYNKINNEYLIYFLEKEIYIHNQEDINILEIVNVFINKLIKNKVSEKFKFKLNSYKNNIEIKKLSSVKYINWLIK